MKYQYPRVGVLLLGLVLFPLSGCIFGGDATSHSGTTHTITLEDKATDITYYKATARMDVRNVTLGFLPDPEKPLAGNPSVHGNQFVRVELAFVNTGAEPFSMRYTSISLSHSAKKEATQTFLIRENNVEDLLKSADIPAGGEVTGAMYFEIPEGDTLSDLQVHYQGYDGQSKQYTIQL